MKEFELAPGESTVRTARKHWLFFAMELLPFAILAVVPFALPKLLTLLPPLAAYLPYLDYHSLIPRAILGMYLLIVWTLAWNAFTRYYLTAWMLTNKRIVDIKQHGYFNREVSSLSLERVQDVTTDVVGVLPSLLDLGDITVQNAGAVDEFHMRSLPHPEQMRDLILRYAGIASGKTSV